ncbi:MAG TPA: thrombospondin type 3 repeat-containing protein, partial [Candidatus Binatia bacterium]|nr:thrombospondin type 3 repeat-containing protein [Candidatus Binatia bacterium]
FYNIINNYLKPGPGTLNTEVAYRLLKPESERSKTVVDNFGKAYVAGNFVDGYPKVTKDNWDGGVQPDVRAEPLKTALAKIRVDEPFPHAPLQIISAQAAYEYVLAHAGATLPRRDSVDERIIKEVRTGVIPALHIAKGSEEKAEFYGYAKKWTDQLGEQVKQGYVTDPSEVGGWPEYKGTPYQDSDGDGMPDDWEKAHGLNPNDPSDATKDSNGDGYSNIEEFIYGLDPQSKKVDWTDLKNNVDPLNG